MTPALAYIRVSDQKQGKSGLGLEAQAADIDTYCEANRIELIDRFVEVETGKGADALALRPQLATALEVARLTGATVIASKLDRITRNVHFGSGLFSRTDVRFIVTSMPHADNFQLNIMLSVAQLEAEMISNRTKAALAAAKRRGVVLGQPIGNARQRAAAVAFAEGLRPIVAPVIDRSSRAIAAHLNSLGVKTPTGAPWRSGTIVRLIDRLNGEA